MSGEVQNPSFSHLSTFVVSIRTWLLCERTAAAVQILSLFVVRLPDKKTYQVCLMAVIGKASIQDIFLLIRSNRTEDSATYTFSRSRF
jgi:hypothetical protein